MMRWASLLSLLLLAFSFQGYGQKIKDGNTAFERKQYHTAIPLLSKAYEKAPTRLEKGKIAFKLAECYRILTRDEQAADWYQKAYDNQFGVDALRELAFCQKRLERYEEAKETFKNLGIEIGSPYEYRREINTCDIAMGWKKIQTPEFRVSLLEFNTQAAEYAPSLYNDKELVFTSDRSSSTGEGVYGWTGNKFSDLFVVNLENQTVRNFSQPWNSDDNEGAISFTANYQEAYFTRCSGGKKEDAFCRILVSTLRNNTWTAPKPLEFQEPNINYGHPSISLDGKKLYFSCNHPDGWGGYDIYVSERTEEGWSPPKVLSRTVNTIGNEQFPYIDGDTLYFSSDFHPGMGGLDIFRTYRMKSGDWAPAFNLKPPVNSGGDDFGFLIYPHAPLKEGVLQTGFFTSNRGNGAGNDDLYQFELLPLPPAPPQPATPPVTAAPRMRLDVIVLEKIYADPANPNSKVLGRKPIPAASLEIRDGKAPKTVAVNEEGSYSLPLAEATDYQFLASKENYLNNASRFTTKGIGLTSGPEEQVFELEIVLDKIFLNKEITLENIYYDYDKWDIRDDAKPTLDALAENLRLNPAIRIQMASHTDCRGNDNYNLELSQKRAQSAVDYLIAAGIDPARLQARGFGETQPAVTCVCTRCTEDQHQANRRTTFAIIE